MAKRRKQRASAPVAHERPAFSWPAASLLVAALIGVFATFGTSLQLEAVDITLATAALAALAGVYAVVSSRVVLQPTRLTLSLVAFLVWSFSAMLASGRGWTAFMGEPTALEGWGAMAAMAAIGWGAACVHRPLRRMLATIAPWLVALQCVWALVQVVNGADGTGTLPNSTYLGEFVVLLLPWTLVDADEWSGAQLWTRAFVALFAVAVLGAAGSRVAAVAALVWAVWTFAHLKAAPQPVRRWGGPIAAAAVVIGGLVFARAEVLGSAGVSTLGARPAMWKLALLAIAKKPVLGWGPDGFTAGGSSVLTPEVAGRGLDLVFRFSSTDPHNIVVFIAVSTGVVGLLLFLWYCVEVVRRWLHLRSEGLIASPAAWGSALCIAVLLTAPLSSHVLPLLALAIGVSVAPLAKRATAASWQRPATLGACALLVVSALAMGASALVRLPFENSGPEVSPAKALASEKASALMPFDPHLAYLVSLHTGYAARTDSSIALRRPDLAAIQRAAALDGASAIYELEYARTLEFYGSTPASVDAAFRESLRRYPGFPNARAEYGLFLARQGRDAAARIQLEIAERLDDDDPQVQQALEAAQKALAE